MRAGERAEPTWVKVAHALLLNGRQLYGRPQKELWPLVIGSDGEPLDPKTCERHVNRMCANGAFFAKDPLRFGPGMGLMIGVSIGAESMRASLVDANGWLLPVPGNEERDSQIGDDLDWHVAELQPAVAQTSLAPDDLVDRIAEAAWRVADRALADERLLVKGKLPLLGVAVAWPTPLGRKTKVPTSAALAHPEWRNEGAPGVRERVATRLRLAADRSHAINDANAVALAAAFDEVRAKADAGDGRFGRTLFALRIGGGLGAGTAVIGSPVSLAPRSAFLETRLVEGASGFAGELGHLPVDQRVVDDVQSPLSAGLEAMPRLPCPCGRPGDPCLQTFASATAFVERMRVSGIGVDGLLHGDERHSTSVMLSAMGNVEDDRQQRAQRDIGRLIGRSLAAPVLMLNPSSITLAGSMAVEKVARGIEDERGRWRHAHSDTLPLQLLEGRANRYASARGAAIAAFRGRVYRRFDSLDTVERPLTSLTLDVARDDIADWNRRGGLMLF